MQGKTLDIHVYTKVKPFPENHTIANDFNLIEMAKILHDMVIYQDEMYKIDLVIHRPLSEDMFVIRLEFAFKFSKASLFRYAKPLINLMNSIREKRCSKVH